MGNYAKTESTHYLQVALPTPLRRVFDYLPPKSGIDALSPGIRLKVPFGPRKLIGILIAITTKTDIPPSSLKHAEHVLDEQPIIPRDLLDLCRWVAHYYHHSLGETLSTAIPVALRQGKPVAQQTRKLWRLTYPAAEVPSNIARNAKLQLAAWQLLKQHLKGLHEPMLKSLGVSNQTLSALEKKGEVECILEELPTLHTMPQSILHEAPLTLNPEQAHVVQQILQAAQQFQTFLLQGITGSGKTEVYLQLIEHTLKAGRQALVLIPEIGLTPQTLHRFEQRFAVPIVVIHSGLNDSERFLAWQKAIDYRAGIIIGTRSAVFTPLAKPGLIIIDEEHDASYKQQDSLRYSARDIAIYRARQANIPIVLGSATPSLETIHNAKAHRYQHLWLTRRAGMAKPPSIELLNIRGETLQAGLSSALQQKITQHLEKDQQVLIFINRRGYAPTLLCHECGWAADCPDCDAHLTIHRQPAHLHCHHCDYQQPIPERCGRCNTASLFPVGAGTERIEDFLIEQFDPTPVIRIDRDSTRGKSRLQQLFKDIHQGEPAILVGTQMLAKGHHFPKVTLVAILDADSGLFSSDFRGLERLGQLITQVAGRAGRGTLAGEVVIQTHHPESPILNSLVTEGYDTFANTLLAEREKLGLPPYGYIGLFRVECKKHEEGEQLLLQLRELINQFLQHNNLNGPLGVTLLGPLPAPMEKRQNWYRWQMLVSSPARQPLHTAIAFAVHQLEGGNQMLVKLARKLRWSVDIDPQDMM
ncbi:primosomal protein N' [Zooshikella marina]|uniref:primosomal protein N' n=1 Tax=Zooshikella ganghwensis TaxID=202772 RepID=UPI001BB0755C|nr:primosomal protein N' [Zooshikella ganghwensis]MBU2708528.1 primosomal protein N' [Zooshikella ganghwensis]